MMTQSIPALPQPLNFNTKRGQFSKLIATNAVHTDLQDKLPMGTSFFDKAQEFPLPPFPEHLHIGVHTEIRGGLRLQGPLNGEAPGFSSFSPPFNPLPTLKIKMDFASEDPFINDKDSLFEFLEEISSLKKAVGIMLVMKSHREKRSVNDNDTTNWFSRVLEWKQYVYLKFFHSRLWGRFRYTMSVSTTILLISSVTDVYMESVGLGDIGDLSTYLDFFWLVYDVAMEIKEFMDENCYYPTYFPINTFTPDHCNPFRLVKETSEYLKQGLEQNTGNLEQNLPAEFRLWNEKKMSMMQRIKKIMDDKVKEAKTKMIKKIGVKETKKSSLTQGMIVQETTQPAKIMQKMEEISQPSISVMQGKEAMYTISPRHNLRPRSKG